MDQDHTVVVEQPAPDAADVKVRRGKAAKSLPSGPVPSKIPNNLSASGAADLARQIERFWAADGWAVRCWTVPVGTSEHGAVYGVRSDLINGHPRGKINA
jgi:hypothetical protein